MAREKLDIVVDAQWKGGQAIGQANKGLKSLSDVTAKGALANELATQRMGAFNRGVSDLANQVMNGTKTMAEAQAETQKLADSLGIAEKQGSKFKGMMTAVAAGAAAFTVVASVAKAAYAAVGEGAQLELSRNRFDNLTASIGATADAMLNELRAASGGMVTDAELIASASDIISLGLADNQTDVVDLATLVSQLGWDMQQVILTFANNSKARLDALGLSVTDVESRMATLEAQGYDTDKAFDLAVIQAGQAKLELLGSAADTTAGDIQKIETAWQNARDEFNRGLAEGSAESLSAITANADDATVGLSKLANDGARTLARAFWEVVDPGGAMRATLERIGAEAQATNRATEDARRQADAYTAWLERQGAAARATAQRQALLSGEVEVTADVLAALGMVTDELTDKSGIYAGQLRREELAARGAGDAANSLASALRGGMAASAETAALKQAALNEQLAIAEQAAMDAAAAFQDDFVSALQDGIPPAETFNDELLGQLDALGASPETYGQAAIALGAYDETQVKAALNAAIMRGRIEELATQFNTGQIDAEQLRLEMEALANGTYNPMIDIDDDPARRKLTALRGELRALQDTPTRHRVEVETVGNFPSAPGGKAGSDAKPTAPIVPDTFNAMGTGGQWVTVPPGYPNDSFIAAMSSGEQYMVRRPGESATSSGVTIDMRNATFGAGTSPQMIKAAVDAAMKQYGQQAQSRTRI